MDAVSFERIPNAKLSMTIKDLMRMQTPMQYTGLMPRTIDLKVYSTNRTAPDENLQYYLFGAVLHNGPDAADGASHSALPL